MDNLKLSALINAYCLINIPLLAFVTPRVIALSDDHAEVRVRLDRRSRNHLGVMYFGALAMGAELSVALKALTAIQQSGKKIDFIFKDFFERISEKGGWSCPLCLLGSGPRARPDQPSRRK